MKRVGRSWYQMNADGTIGQVYADARALRADDMPYANVPGLPGSTRAKQALNARYGKQREYSRDYERARSWTFEIDWSAETEDPAVVLRRKVAVLAERGATEGERAAARAALERLDARR